MPDCSKIVMGIMVFCGSFLFAVVFFFFQKVGYFGKVVFVLSRNWILEMLGSGILYNDL